MKVTDVLTKEFIIPELKGKEKREVLEEMSEEVAGRVEGINKERLLELLLEREKLGSTGIGHGVAIPHTKMKGIEGIVVAFGRSKRGVKFQSMDNRPVHIFFLIVAPEDSTVLHLKVLASISRLLKDGAFRKRLIKASTKEDIYRIMKEEDNKVLKSAIA